MLTADSWEKQGATEVRGMSLREVETSILYETLPVPLSGDLCRHGRQEKGVSLKSGKFKPPFFMKLLPVPRSGDLFRLLH